MLGKISSATEHGIKSTILTESTRSKQQLFYRTLMMWCTTVGVEFFNDILVPPDLLLDGARL